MNLNLKSKAKIVNDDSIDAFHDRELVLYGVEWLEQKIKSYADDTNFNLLKDYK